MGYSKISIVLCLTVCLSVLFAPFVLEISPDGKTYAMGFLGSSGGGNESSSNRALVADSESKPGDQPTVHPTPEPATLLLVGGGALGLAALRKKFKKK